MSSVFSTNSLSLTHSLSVFAKKEKTANRSIATGSGIIFITFYEKLPNRLCTQHWHQRFLCLAMQVSSFRTYKVAANLGRGRLLFCVY